MNWFKKIFSVAKVKMCKHKHVGWCWLAQRVEYRECLDCGYGECENPTTGEFDVLNKLNSDKNDAVSDTTKADM